MRKLRALLATISVAAATSALAQATPAAPAPEPEGKVHRGFYLRLDGGVGYAGMSASQGGLDASIKGFSSQFGVAVGAAVARNFILAGEVWGGVIWSPTVTVNGISTSSASATAAYFGFGPQLTYYFMPANVYVSVTPALTIATLTYQGSSANTKAGFGGRIAVGKEWMVGDRWGLGLAAQFLFSLNQDSGDGSPPTWTTLGGGLSFSATFN